MLINDLNECIADMKTIQELETVSIGEKKQAEANYNFKHLVSNTKTIVNEIELAINNSNFKPSTMITTNLNSVVISCEKIIADEKAVNSTTSYIQNNLKKIYENIGEEWGDYYNQNTAKIISLLETVKAITSNPDKVTYTLRKIKGALKWNKTLQNYLLMNQGLLEARDILNELDLDENSYEWEFLKLLASGNATIEDLTDDILRWIRNEKLASKISLKFYS